MSELPEGWSLTNLKELGGLVGGKTPSKSESRYWQAGTVPWVSPKDMKSATIENSEDHITTEALTDAGMKLLPKDTVLMVIRSGILAHTFPVAIAKREVTINQDLKAIAPSLAAQPNYLLYLLMAAGREILQTCTKDGTTVASVETDKLEALPLRLAPLAEQKHIADKLDALLARVDACRERLDRVPQILKRFRQSVLAAAVEGRLTEDWRNGTTASTWSYERAGEVCQKVQSGGTPKSGFVDSPGVPFLKVYNIVNQRIDFDYRPQYVTVAIQSHELAKSRTMPGDVLMNIVGPPLGKVAVVTSQYPEWNINQAITLFRPSARILTGWIYYFLCSGFSISEIVHETRGSAGQTNISLSQCRDFVFPVPPLPEQHEIVRRVEALFAIADRLEARVTAAQARAETLTPALLAKAFRGELVPQDPNDEPASALLARVRGLQATTEAAPKRRRRAEA